MTKNKITEGNAFALNIRQAVWRTLGGVIQPLLASELVDVHLYVGSGTSKSTATEYNVTADGDTISAVMPATLKRGVYRTWMTALYQGREVASACECAFEIVAFDEHGIYAPERIDGQPCVYLQGASMTDPEIEQYKARLLELQQQREQEVQALEAERNRVAEVAAQMEDVATEKTQQLMIKQITAIAESADISGLMNVKAAIELKGGQDVYSNPEQPKLTELARNVGTIPQEFIKYTPEGVRYDDPVEWHVFNQDVAYAVEAARAFQNRINTEGGIQSILHPNVKYNGFILVDVNLYCLQYDNGGNYYYMQFDNTYADAYMISYNGNAYSLVEWEVTDAKKKIVKIELDKMLGNEHFYLILLYKDDAYTCTFPQIDYVRTSNLGDIVIGGHPLSVTMNPRNNIIRNCIIQLNVTERTDFYINQSANFIYLRNKRGSVRAEGQFIYLEQYEEAEINDNMVLTNYNHGIFMPKLQHIINLEYETQYGPIKQSFDAAEIEGLIYNNKNALEVYFPNLRTIDIKYPEKNNNFQVDISGEKIVKISYPELIEVKNSNYDIYLLHNNRFVEEFELPKLEIADKVQNFVPANNCINLKRFSAPNLVHAYNYSNSGISLKIENCPNLEEIYVPKLRSFASYDGTLVGNESSKLRKMTVGNIRNVMEYNNGISGNLGRNSLIHFPDLIQVRYAETVDENQFLYAWRPTNALNNSISTLVEEGDVFANNREKFLWNFRNYIIAMLYDHMPAGVSDGQTRSITLHKSVVDVLTEEDKAAITAKGWNILVTT